MRNGVPEGCVEIKCSHASKDLCISDAVNCKKKTFVYNKLKMV